MASAFVSDQFTVGRMTFNVGVRGIATWVKPGRQIQHAYSFGPLVFEEKTFPPETYFTWN